MTEMTTMSTNFTTKVTIQSQIMRKVKTPWPLVQNNIQIASTKVKDMRGSYAFDINQGERPKFYNAQEKFSNHMRI